jgi:Tol biopolymer transport system component
MIGKTLAHYKILEPLGTGGMGEVYRARDTTLDREVAIKVLPAELATDPERLARLEREARVLAQLEHPNIAAIYGLEEAAPSGASETIRFLVMQLADGETLAGRIARGPIAVEEALAIGLQIAEGLEAAHDKGIVHRDLKPANVKVAEDADGSSRVKILDFGLAKALAADGAAAEISPDISNSPTVAAATRAGVILGTAAYMSPEQARGRPLDRRSDIWAFGCVLYEMLSGRRAFSGDDVSETLAAVLRDDPDWASIPRTTPAPVRALLHRCLTRDVRERLQAIGEARYVLALAARGEAPVAGGAGPGIERRSLVGTGLALLAAGLVVGTLAGTWIAGNRGPAGLPAGPSSFADRPPIAGIVDLSAAAPLAFGTASIGFDSPLLALSPDGNWLVFVGATNGESRLYRHRLDGFAPPEAIPGTEGAIHPFFSPNGEWISFLTDDRLKRVSLAGETVETITPTRSAVLASWPDDDWIYYQDNQNTGPLRRVRVSAMGGGPEDVRDLRFWVQEVVAGGRFALGVERIPPTSGDYAGVMWADLETGEHRRLPVSGYGPHWVSTGQLVFVRGGNVLGVGFDIETGEVIGEPIILRSGVAMESLFYGAQFALSQGGTLAYVPGADRSVGRLTVHDRSGATTFPDAPAQIYNSLDLSPDDRFLAVHIADVTDRVWVYDRQQGRGVQVSGSDGFGWPVWSADGDVLGFSSVSRPTGVLESEVRMQTYPAALREESLQSPGIAHALSSKGDVTVASGPSRIGFLSPDEPIRWMNDLSGDQWGAAFSPDADWFVYASNETGRFEIWARSYPDLGPPQQLSFDGGVEPAWCGACGELFFRWRNDFFSTSAALGEGTVPNPRRVFTVPDFVDTLGRSYDVSRDGQRLFVVTRAEPAIVDRIHVVANWFDELRARVPRPLR